MIETGQLQAPLCGVTEAPRERRFPGRCHGQTAVWPSSWVVLCHVGFLGGLACVAYTLLALPHAPPHVPTVALSQSSPAAYVGSTGELRDSTNWLQWLWDHIKQLKDLGKKRYFDFWGQTADDLCVKYKISNTCCHEMKTEIGGVRWSIYDIAILSFAVGAFVVWAIFKVGTRVRPKVPRYWNNSTWILPPFFDSFNDEVDVTEALKDAVQELFDLTTDPRRMGKGMDGSFVKHKGLRVTNVTRIENGPLWTSYMHAVSSTVRRTPREFMKKIAEGLKDNLQCALLILERHNRKIRSKEAARSFVDSLQLQDCFNETLLFHASPGPGARDPQTGELRFDDTMSPLEAVKKAGIDDRVGSASGMLGSGTYFADMASKADQYAGKYGPPTESTLGETASMFLSRVALGCPYLTQRSLEQMRRPPCLKGHFDQSLLWSTVKIGKPWKEKGLPLQICEHHRFDSVISDRQVDEGAKLYHEYAVYAKQCYPEFCVTYERTEERSQENKQ